MIKMYFILNWTSFIFSYIKQCKQIFFKTEWGSWWGIHGLRDLAYFYFLLLSFHMRMQSLIICTFKSKKNHLLYSHSLCKFALYIIFMLIAYFFFKKFKQATGKSILKVFVLALIIPQHSCTDTEWLLWFYKSLTYYTRLVNQVCSFYVNYYNRKCLTLPGSYIV